MQMGFTAFKGGTELLQAFYGQVSCGFTPSGACYILNVLEDAMTPSDFGLSSSVSGKTFNIFAKNSFQPQDWPAMPGPLCFYQENASRVIFTTLYPERLRP